LVSAALEGRLIVWDAVTANKLKVIALETLWVMCCSISPSANLVVSGGLDNICSIFKMEDELPITASSELTGHSAFISSCKFLNSRSSQQNHLELRGQNDQLVGCTIIVQD